MPIKHLLVIAPTPAPVQPVRKGWDPYGAVQVKDLPGVDSVWVYGRASDTPAQPLEPLRALLTAQQIPSRAIHGALVQAHGLLQQVHARALQVWERSGRDHATYQTEIGPVIQAEYHLERVTVAIQIELTKDRGKTPAERALARVGPKTPRACGSPTTA